MFQLWVKHALLSVVAASPYIPVHTAIVIADPTDCDARETIDWQLVWSRNRLRDASREKIAGRGRDGAVAGLTP